MAFVFAFTLVTQLDKCKREYYFFFRSDFYFLFCDTFVSGDHISYRLVTSSLIWYVIIRDSWNIEECAICRFRPEPQTVKPFVVVPFAIDLAIGRVVLPLFGCHFYFRCEFGICLRMQRRQTILRSVIESIYLRSNAIRMLASGCCTVEHVQFITQHCFLYTNCSTNCGNID